MKRKKRKKEDTRIRVVEVVGEENENKTHGNAFHLWVATGKERRFKRHVWVGAVLQKQYVYAEKAMCDQWINGWIIKKC